MMEFGAKLSLKDNMSSTLQRNLQKQREFQSEIRNTRDQLQKVAKEKYDITVNSSGMKKAVKDIQTTKAKLKEVEDPVWLQMYVNEREAVQKINDFKAKISDLKGKVIAQKIQIKDATGEKIETIRYKISSLGQISPVLRVRDKASKQVADLKYKMSMLSSVIKAPVLTVRDKMSSHISKVKANFRAVRDLMIKPVAIKAVNKASGVITKVKSGVKTLGKMVANPVIKVKDLAGKGISKVNGALKNVGKVFTPIVKLKDMASKAVGSVYGGLKRVGSFVAKPVVALKDSASSSLSKMGGMLKNLAKGVTIAVGIAGAGATALLGGALKSGAMLEQQQISIEHFVGVNNKDKSQDQIKQMSDDYMKELRNNANLTPFETNEVISAGSRAINVSGGDTGSAMSMLKVAEDMASLNPEKSLSDAMEAIADMKNGETERMKEFGFKISAEDIKKAGGTDAIIKNQLAPYFSGGAEKLSQSASGMVSTIKGNIGTALSDTGLAMIEKVKPLLEKMVGLTNTLAPKLQGIGEKIAEGFGVGVQWVMDLMNKSGGITPLFSGIGSTLKSVFTSAKPIIESVIGGIGTTIKTMLPVFSEISAMAQRVFPVIGETIAEVFSGSGGRVEGFKGIIQSAIPIVEGLINNAVLVFKSVQPIITSLWQSAQRIFPIIGTTILNAFRMALPIIGVFKNIIVSAMPVVENIIRIFCGVVNALMPIVSTIFKGVGEKVGRVIDFIGSKMGFIQEVISFAVPIIKDILTTAWSIISPVMDIMISVFEAVWDVIEFVFPAIQGVIETVWGVLDPIFSAIADALTWVGDAVDSVIGWFGNVFDGVFDGGAEGSTKKDDGSSRAMGVNRVPYDNYPMRAHEGEMLLTKREANNYVAQTRGVQMAEQPKAVGSSNNTSIVASDTGSKQETKQDQRPIVIEKFVGIESATITNEADEDRVVEKMVTKFKKLIPNMT